VVENILGELRASCSGVDNHFMPTETHEHGNGVQTKTPSGGGETERTYAEVIRPTAKNS